MSSAVNPVSTYQYGIGQRDDHQRRGAKRIDLFRAVVLRRSLGSCLLVEQLPEWFGLLLVFQHNERVALAEAR